MRQRNMAFFLSGMLLAGGAMWACGSSSTGPSAIACGGGTPDLTGTWTLDTFAVNHTPPLYPPTATGTFIFFAGDSVNVTLNVPLGGSTQNIGGVGSCHLVGNQIQINSNGLLGQPKGTYVFVPERPAAADTLHATLISTGDTIRVVVTR